MKIAHLAVGDRNFYLQPEEAEVILSVAASARLSGDWLTMHDASGREFMILIPSQALLVFRVYEVDDVDPTVEAEEWTASDYEW